MSDDELNAIERDYERYHADDFFVASGHVERLIAEVRRLRDVSVRIAAGQYVVPGDMLNCIGTITPLEPFLDIEGIKRQAAAEERAYICKELDRCRDSEYDSMADWIRKLPVL